MTTTPIDATGVPSPTWVLRRDGDGDVLVPAGQPADGGSAAQPELGFLDFLDVINPLQHLPVVGTIYRAMTGDTIGDAARVAGGALYGGPFGLIGGLANVVFEAETGGDIGENVVAWLSDEPDAGTGDGSMLAAQDAAQDVGQDIGQPATAAAPINAAPVTTAAAFAAVAARGAAVQGAAAQGGGAPGPDTAAGPATSEFAGRSADRLDSFIRQANAVRRGNPLAVDRGATAAAAAPPGIDPARLQAAVLQPPGVATHADGPAEDEVRPGGALEVAGSDAGSVNQWMLRALDKYEHMRNQETS